MKLQKSSKYIKNTMAKAAEVQARYNEIGAPSTQRVRNPIPMHKLVLSVLPTLLNPDELVPVEKKVTITVMGQKFVKKVKGTESVCEVLGDDYYRNKGMTVNEVQLKLCQMGFIATRDTVAVALSLSPQVHSIAGQSDNFTFGRPQSRYFLIHK